MAADALQRLEFPRTVQINAGSFQMGVGRTPLPFELTTSSYHRCTPRAADPAGCGKLFGDYDERHNHHVTISRDFEMTVTEVTNSQFEAFDPSHRQQRGRLGFSVQDYEAVIFVSHAEATNYARWLSARDPAGRTWRLPTEAEWEYACRANTTTHFNTGDTFPASQGRYQDVTDFPRCKFAPAGGPCRSSSQLDGFLKVAAHPPNAWGLHDCHGNVEEWTSDWYGADYYSHAAPVDPQGPPSGTFRVARGGSHSTEVYYLRSGNRMANLPNERTWVTGFRLVATPNHTSRMLTSATAAAVDKDGPATTVSGLHDVAGAPRLAGRTYKPHAAERPLPASSAPAFRGPAQYVRIANGSTGPLWSKHNHDPALAVIPDSGDVIAVWFTTYTEPGREAALAMSRLRNGSTEWENATSLYLPPKTQPPYYTPAVSDD